MTTKQGAEPNYDEITAAIEEYLSDQVYDKTVKSIRAYLKQEYKLSPGAANDVVVRLRENSKYYSKETRAFLGGRHQEQILTICGSRNGEYSARTPGGELPDMSPIFNPYSAGCLPGDHIAVRLFSARHVHCVRWLSRGQKRWVCKLYGVLARKGTVTSFRAMPLDPLSPTVIHVHSDTPIDVKTLRKDAFEVELDDQSPDLQKKGWGEPMVKARFLRSVGSRFDPLGEVAIAQAEFGIPVSFSEGSLAEVSRLPENPDAASMKHRVDLRDVPFVTIDGEDARDFDDAVYAQALPAGGWRLLVAIADVSYYVRPGSELDRDAQRRGTSVYFPASVVPMLPEALSNGLCSLNPDVDRLTLVCDAVLDALGNVTAYQFYPAVIHSHARLTYNRVYDALRGNEATIKSLGERWGDIETLYALSKARLELRKQRHAMDFSTTESKAIFDEKGYISGFEDRRINDANRLIEECMLVANVCAAEFVLKKKRLTLFRVHDKPSEDRLRSLNVVLRNFGLPAVSADPEKLSEVIGLCHDREFLQTQILRSMSRACYTPENIGHFGLQFEAYAHFTSPIRRYPDLLLHRTIKGILSRRRYVPELLVADAQMLEERFLPAREDSASRRDAVPAAAAASGAGLETWERLGQLCSAAERRADEASRAVMNYLKCEFFLKYINTQKTRKFKGVVTGVISAGIFVQIKPFGIEGFVHVSRLGWGYYDFDERTQSLESDDEDISYRVGDHVQVSDPDVDLESRRISFSWCSQQEHRHARKRQPW